VAVFQIPTQPGNAQAVKEVELAAGAFGVKLHYADLKQGPDKRTVVQWRFIYKKELREANPRG
jgi:hypothetical protein